MQYFDPSTAEGGVGSTFPGYPFSFPSQTTANANQPPGDGQETQDQYEDSSDNQQGLTLQTLLRQTGLGIKVRFLLALTLIALFPALILVSLLGDPFGQEQHAALGQALILQAHAQASAVDQAIAIHQFAVSNLAKRTLLPRFVSGTPNLGDQVSGMLQTVQQVDPASLAWLLLQSGGKILAAGDTPDHLVGLQLSQSKIVSDPTQLTQLISAVSHGTPGGTPLLSSDKHIPGGWMAMAYPVSQSKTSSSAVLLAVFSLQKVTQGLITTTSSLDSTTAVLLDQQGRVVVNSGPLARGQQVFAFASPVLRTLLASAATPTLIDNDPLTGRTDIAVSVPVKTLNGHYLLLAPQNTALAPSSRVFFAGRNTPLLILAILVAVVLVATWVALPIVRPIRRATREIGYTTGEVRKLASNARRIAKEHATGTALLSGASKRLGGRRQSIIRDVTAIAHICRTLWPRIQWLQQMVQGSPNKYVLEALQSLQQGVYQINELGIAIISGLESDNFLSQLDGAMESSREISMQFEAAGTELEHDAEQLEIAARTLL
jgi:hypothetical protein